MLRLATRSSQLAIAQAEAVRQLLDAAGFAAALVPIGAASGGAGTSGRARGQAAPRHGIAEQPSGRAPADKGRFVRGAEEALLTGEADIGVHSAKDLPSDLLPGLRLAGAPARGEAADAFVGRWRGGTAGPASLSDLPVGARIGTASLRRRSQLLALRPDLRVEELRGNVDTRLALVEERGLDGAVLAVAGLARLGREGEITFRFGPGEMLPAAGQGTLALEIREGDEAAAAAVAAITHAATWTELIAERALVRALDADCDTPMGARAIAGKDGPLELAAYVGRADGSDWVRDRVASGASNAVEPSAAATGPGATSATAEAKALGVQLANRLLAVGADAILGRA